jgi:Predicted membrane protein
MTQAVDQAHQAGASNRSTALILGLVAVLISGTILMGQLERGLNRIYGIEQDRPTASKYLHAFVLAITAGLLITAAFVTLGVGRSVAASLGSHTSVQIWNVIRWPVGLALAMVAIALLYRWAPRRRQPAWSWLGFGSFVAVGIWTLSTIGLSLFFRSQLLVRSDVRTAGGDHRARALGVPGVRGSPLRRCGRSAAGGGTRRHARAS